MKKTQQLLTIGQLAKFSGLHVKALRYYEKIGILNPTAIDKQNGYRYYSYAHIPYVNMIKICANYGLPLKQFAHYILDDGSIDMNAILKEAQLKIEEKERQLQSDERYLRFFSEQINFSQKLDKTTNLHIEQGNKDYFLLPFTGEMLSAKYYEAVRCALAEIEKCQMTFDDRVGCYFKYDDQQVNSFIAIKIKECQEDKTNFLSLCLNHRHIHAQHLTKDRIQPKIKELHQKESINEFLILETFESPYQLSQPHLEMQYVVDNTG